MIFQMPLSKWFCFLKLHFSKKPSCFLYLLVILNDTYALMCPHYYDYKFLFTVMHGDVLSSSTTHLI